MRATILALTLLISGASVAGSTDTLPNAGLFVFDTPPVITTVPVMLASR